jgi:Rieske Fe-S protein
MDPIKKRLEEKYKGQVPKWAEDFPLDARKDSDVSRRDFIRYLSLVSFGFFAAIAGVWGQSFLKLRGPASIMPRLRIIGRDDMKIGDSYVFEIPGVKEHAMLIRLSENDYAAFGQKCTHLQCPVLWKNDQKILYCPCHKGAFEGTTGNVLYGPPERPLPKLKLEIAQDGIYFVGMERGELI